MMSRCAASILSALALCITLAPGATHAAGDKPRLSDEISAALDAGGVEAAKRRFAQIYPANKDDYELDFQALGELGADYMKAGDMPAGMAVMEMTSTLGQAMVAEMLDGETGDTLRQMQASQATLDARAAARREAEPEADAAEREARRVERRGPARDDLERFTGLYGDPAEGNRRLWVRASCEGQLVVGATWGDAAPWWLKSLGESEFGVDTDVQSLHVIFDEGNAIAMHHDLEFMTTPLARVDDLPEKSGDCLERYVN